MTEHHLKRRSDIHLARKIWHIFGISIIALIYYLSNRVMALQIATLVTVIFVLLDLVRQHWTTLNELLMSVFHPIMRVKEKDHMAGTSYLFIGVLLILYLVTDKNIVTLSLLFVAFGDPIASYVGIRHGKDKILGSKSLQGTIGAFVTCTLIFALYSYYHNLMTDRLVIVSLLAGLSGALAELLPIGKIDDNFTMPVISAIFLKLLFYFFAGY